MIQRSCKICNLLDTKLIENINYDILSGLSYNDIIKKYKSYLPDGIDLNPANISVHKKHISPEHILKKVIKLPEEVDIIEGVFKEVYKKSLDKIKILNETYRQRINNLFYLQVLLNNYKNKLKDLNIIYELAVDEDKDKVYQEIEKVEKKITEMVIEIDTILHKINEVLIKDSKVEKGIPENVNIMQVNIFYSKLRDVLDEFVPYIMMEIFPDNPNKGKEVVNTFLDIIENKIKINNNIQDISYLEINKNEG